jgi:hypothetical protein
MHLLLLSIALLSSRTLMAQAAPTRWALEVRTPATVERGELRLNGSVGRLLLESADSAYVALPDLTLEGSRIAFTSPADRRRFEGVVSSTAMSGTVHDGDGRTMLWRAEAIPPGVERWPVRPRVTVRQLMIGSAVTATVVPASWRAAAPTRNQIRAEYDSLAALAGMTSVSGLDLLRRAPLVALGLDRESRAAARMILTQIASSSAADPEFNRIFRSRGGLRLDLHEVALQSARLRRPDLQLARAARALSKLRLVPQGSADTLAVYEGAWRLWSRMGRDSLATTTLIDSLALQDAEGWNDVRALLLGYGAASDWWRSAVQWLLSRPWLTLADGRATSPAQLVAAFWDRQNLPMPAIEPTRFGGVQAVPALGGSRLGTRLVRPANASAVEWLANGGITGALDVWRSVDMSDGMVVDAGGRLAQLTAPAAVDRSRLGGFFASRDAIRIEPGILPILAVATAVHEWQHLLFEGTRLEGAAHGVVDDGRQLRIVESDPWLGEGAAEWATEVTLAPVHARVPFFAFMEAEKRGGIALASQDDPHVLGYLLVRAAADRGLARGQVRERLVRLLHDPGGFAIESGFARPPGGASIALPRPATLAIIPEITFTWDDGVAEGMQRRLLVPATTMDR